jgi:signal transduction histidine kinase/ActR/RegA family two-component response regulator
LESWRRRAAALELYLELFEHAPAGYLILDLAARIRRINAAAKEMMGGNSDVVGKNLLTLIQKSDRPRLLRSMLRSRQTNAVCCAEIRLAKPLKQTPLQFWLRPGHKDPGTLWVAVTDSARSESDFERDPHDLRESNRRLVDEMARRHSVEQELQRYSEALEAVNQELQNSYAEFRELQEARIQSEQLARAEAETANRIKDEFLATLSHELRTPLNAMLGWSRLLRTGKLKHADFERGLEAIERNVHTQVQLVNDLLDMSRIIAGKFSLQLEAVELQPMIMSVVESLRPTAAAKRVRLSSRLPKQPLKLTCDPARLHQIVSNLLTNAIKFTPAQGSVEVRGARINQCVQIEIKDTGDGIKPEFLGRIFDRFWQADASSTRSQSGLGLGLSIVRSLVEAHHGTIRAHSEGLGKGSRFTVELPLAEWIQPSSAPAAPPSLQREYSLEGVRVLVVDDDSDARTVIRKQLESVRAVVRCATSGAEAISDYKGFQPDVIISDIAMPEVDGYELIRRIRQYEETIGRYAPALALTAFGRSQDQDHALRAGFQAYLTKPVEPHRIAEAVAALASSERKP